MGGLYDYWTKAMWIKEHETQEKEIDRLHNEVEWLQYAINSLAQEFDAQHKMVASRYVAERLMALGSE